MLYRQIRANNRYTYATSGNDVAGWAWALRHCTHAAVCAAKSFTSRTAAVNAIVEAIDRTNHPVGVTVKRGTHAWVVLGYKASGPAGRPHEAHDPRGVRLRAARARLQRPVAVQVLQPASFAKVFTAYHEWQRRVVWEGRYVIVAD